MLKLKTTAQSLKIFYLFCVVFLLPTYLARFLIFGIPTTMLEILIWVGLAWSLVNWREWKKITALPKLVKISVKLILLGAIIGFFVSPNKTSALGQFKGFILDPLLFAGLVYIWFPNPTQKISTAIKTNVASYFYASRYRGAQIYDGLILSGVILSLIALWQKLSGATTPNERSLSIWQWDTGASPNYLSMYLAPIGVLAFCQLKSQKNKLWILGFGFLIIVCGIVVSGSRAGLLSAGAGILFFILQKYSIFYNLKSKFFKNVVWCLCLLLIVSAIYFAGRPNLSASPNSSRVSSSNNIRWEIWRVAIKEILPSHWLFGVGFGNFQNHFTTLTQGRVNFPEYISPRALTPHNLYLHIWFSGGIIMLIGFLSLFWQIFKNPASNSSWLEKSVIVSILIYGLIDTPIFKNDLGVIWWVVIAVYLVKNNEEKN